MPHAIMLNGWVGAWLAVRLGGYPMMFTLLAGLAAVAVAFLAASIPPAA